mgnify:CR=1 FL=1
MGNETDDLKQKVLRLVRSYIRRGASAKFDIDPKTGKPFSAMSGEGVLPVELYAILKLMLGEDSPIPDEIADFFRIYDGKLRQEEASLTEDELIQLKTFYQQLLTAKNRKELAAVEKLLPGLDGNVQKTIENQRRLRQALATKILEAWNEFNQEEEEGEGEDGEEGDDDGEGSQNSQHSDPSDMTEDDQESGDEGDDGDDGQEGDGDGDGEPYGETSEHPTDFREGAEKWLKELEEETQKDQAEAEKQAEADAEEAAGGGEEEGEQGNLPFGDPDNPSPGDTAFDLDNMKADLNPADAQRVQQAFSKLLSMGKDNPTALPRWDKREVNKRLQTQRSLKPAKRPTVERKAVMFIIDNSPSMSRLEGQSRALAAALSAASGPGGADVIVALSYNGEFGNRGSDRNAKQAGCWFKNGKFEGELPLPYKGGPYDQKHHGRCWEWFIEKKLPSRGVNVHLIGIYGDYNGGAIWSYISNKVKEVSCLWFNPTDRSDGPYFLERRPVIHGRSGVNSYPFHVKGDTRFEIFRGLHFLRIDTVEEMAAALRRHIT